MIATLIRKYLIGPIVWIEKLIEKFHKPDCLTTYPQLVDAASRMINGDILFERCDLMLSNWFIPGQWKHCAVYMNGYVYEASAVGVRRVNFQEWFFKKDHVGIARYNKVLTVDDQAKGLNFMASCLGDPYNYEFSMSAKTQWYCSEYVYCFFKQCDPNFIFPLKSILGDLTVEPTDFWSSSQFTKLVSYN